MTSAMTCYGSCSSPAIRCCRPRRARRSRCGCWAASAPTEIARAFLVPEPTIAQRIVRAKRTLAEARMPFEAPRAAERAARVSSVLEVIYLIFNEGYAATARRGLDAPRTVRGSPAVGPHFGGTPAPRSGGARPRGADGNPGFALGGARRCRGRADLAAGAESGTLEPAHDPARARRARTRRGARGRLGTVRPAGSDRRLSRPGRAAADTDWRESSRCTMHSPSSRPRRSWN